MAEPSLFDHVNPAIYSSSNPLSTFIVQWAVITGFSYVIALGLGKARQPKVVAEVLAGIVIGPTALGRISAFRENIFPAASIPNLNLVANIGLVLFLFLVGLEVDFAVFRKYAVKSMSIGTVSIAVPFGAGAALSVGLFHHFVDEKAKSFGIFVLFIGTAMSITALPVLARILSELRLLQDPVGVIVLGAGVANDVVGWILLALAIALVNASTGIIVLYVILCIFGLVLFLFLVVRKLLVKGLIWNGTLSRSGTTKLRDPSQRAVALIVFMIFTCAWFTEKIGVHAIFGGFLMGLIIPPPVRPSLVEKVEDLISVLCLPLYFALSGLNTDMTLLNSGKIWAWTIGVTLVAVFAKFLPSAIAAKATRMSMRESCAIGSLMACKGLVELVVLNVGLHAGILNDRIFAMFVFMALITTFATTPSTLLFYYERVRNVTEAAASEQAAAIERAIAMDEAEKEAAAAVSPSSSSSSMHSVTDHIDNGNDELPATADHDVTDESNVHNPENDEESKFKKTDNDQFRDQIHSSNSSSFGGAIGSLRRAMAYPSLGKQYLEHKHLDSVLGQTRIGVILENFVDLQPALSISLLLVDKSLISRKYSVPRIHSLTHVELTERLSTIMQASSVGTPDTSITKTDPLSVAYRSCMSIQGIQCRQSASISNRDAFLIDINKILAPSPIVILPWLWTSSNDMWNLHDYSFARAFFEQSQSSHSSMISSTAADSLSARQTRILYLDHDNQDVTTDSTLLQTCIILIFVGGPDDRAALTTLYQILRTHSQASAIIYKVADTVESSNSPSRDHVAISSSLREDIDTLKLSSFFGSRITHEEIAISKDVLHDALRIVSIASASSSLVILGRNVRKSRSQLTHPWYLNLHRRITTMRYGQIIHAMRDASLQVRPGVDISDTLESSGDLSGLLLICNSLRSLVIVQSGSSNHV